MTESMSMIERAESLSSRRRSSANPLVCAMVLCNKCIIELVRVTAIQKKSLTVENLDCSASASAGAFSHKTRANDLCEALEYLRIDIENKIKKEIKHTFEDRKYNCFATTVATKQ